MNPLPVLLRTSLLFLCVTEPVLGQPVSTTSASARPELIIPVAVPLDGDHAEVSLPVDACTSLRVLTHFLSDACRASFVKPDGTGLPWAEGTSGLAFRKEAIPPKPDGTGGGFVYEAIVTSPVTGEWKLLLQWPEAQLPGAGTLVYASWLDSRIEMNVIVPGSAFATGTKVFATLALMEDRKPRHRAAIEARLFRDGELAGPVTFAVEAFPDLGTKALITELPVAGPGQYVLKVEATGQGETGPFRRSAMADFEVYVPRGRFRGTFTSALQ